MNPFIILLRMGITFAMAMVFGLERQRAHKPIGFGTYSFVSVGACALAITALVLNYENPLPLLGAIITGIGFLGAGALIKTTDKIFGFTTAASIWVFSIIGLVIGVGEYFIGALVYAFIWLVLLIDYYLEHRSIGSYRKKIVLSSERSIPNDELSSLFRQNAFKIMSAEINKKDKLFTLILYVEGKKEEINNIPNLLFKKEHIVSFKIE